MNTKLFFMLVAIAVTSASRAQVLTTPGGVVGSNTTTDQVFVTGQTKLINPNGRALVIEKDNGDSWLTFLDPDNFFYSMGIDRSNNGSFLLNRGGELGTTNNFVLTYTGTIGLGTAVPRAKLDVAGLLNGGVLGTVLGRLSEGDGSGDGTYLGVRGFATQETEYNGKSFSLEHGFYGSVNSSINFHRGNAVTGGYLTFNTYNNIERLRITPGGDVAIGTTTADAKLTVKGDVHAREVRVDLGGSIGPDYVFEQDYALLSLQELERYIQQNKHLPEILSAAEMEANGLKLMEMNLLLLKKVEELTLHAIEQQKAIDTLTSKVNNSESK
ncbi:tail fiber protein [Parachryseolinea silvisoli]|uniref:tail fiber protein n=1 Tax=Parachryseolinea silvisoli TaxID=2873601 RepID=UPI002265DF07|nr:tail fiber protein [Parachryseolinea silvisoli]MCD9014744.1 hypothetical protein [Parachryseolinea silvisoli]